MSMPVAAEAAGFSIEFDPRKIDAIFAEFDQCHLPGAAVGIAIGGRPVYRKGFGLANMELPVVLSPAIRMRIASTSKHFTAFAYMLLCEEGKAGVDDPIGKYLPELHAVARNVTVRQLMGNVSGLRDVFDIAWQFSGTARPMSTPISGAELLRMYRDIDDVNAPPGTTWSYNNGGFLLLSVAIERIAGQPLETVLRERIFEPIGMYDTLLRRTEGGFVPNSAALHKKNNAGEYERSNFNGTAFAGEGGMVSTVDDMLRWLVHMDAPVVGNAATWRTMKTPQRLANGSSSGYGLGLLVDRYRGIDILHHPGGAMGGNAQMMKVPAVGLDVIVVVNCEASSVVLANRILDACVMGLDADEEIFTGPIATGTFRSPSTGRVAQLFAEDGRQVVSIDGFDRRIFADDDGVLWPAGTSRYAKQGVTLVGDPEKPAAIHLSDFGNIDELMREGPPLQTGGQTGIQTIVGRYRSSSTGTEAAICSIDGTPRLTTTGRFGSLVYGLECLADGIWRARRTWISPPTGGILLFDPDRGAFRFSSYRTTALVFRRDTR